MTAALDSKLWWYASRSSGLVLWLLLVASVLWGLAVSSRLVRRRGMPAWMLDLHKHLATLVVVFLVVHLVALWADDFVHFGPVELLVPFTSEWKPVAVAWGIFATYLIAAVQLTSWRMRRIPRRVWHAVHLSSLAALVLATAHGITSGSDWSNRAVKLGTWLGGAVVVWLVAFRLLSRRAESKVGPVPTPAERLAALQAARAGRAGSVGGGAPRPARPPRSGGALPPPSGTVVVDVPPPRAGGAE